MKSKVVINNMPRNEIYASLRMMRMSALVSLLKYQFENNAQFADICFEDRIASIVYEARERFLDRQVARIIERGSGRNPLGAAKESIVYGPERNLNREVMHSLLSMDWVRGDRPSYVTISGESGTGKTYLMEALIREACIYNLNVAYFDFGNFTKLTEDAKTETDLDQVFNRLNRKDLIVIDDFGLFRCTEGAIKLLFRLIDRRLGCGALLIGSQYHFDDWYAYFAGEEGDSGIADATIGRLKNNSQMIELKGPSLREKYGCTGRLREIEDELVS